MIISQLIWIPVSCTVSLVVSISGCPPVREKLGKFGFQGQGKVREFFKMVREIRKSSKVREKSGNLIIMLG